MTSGGFLCGLRLTPLAAADKLQLVRFPLGTSQPDSRSLRRPPQPTSYNSCGSPWGFDPVFCEAASSAAGPPAQRRTPEPVAACSLVALVGLVPRSEVHHRSIGQCHDAAKIVTSETGVGWVDLGQGRRGVDMQGLEPGLEGRFLPCSAVSDEVLWPRPRVWPGVDVRGPSLHQSHRFAPVVHESA